MPFKIGLLSNYKVISEIACDIIVKHGDTRRKQTSKQTEYI